MNDEKKSLVLEPHEQELIVKLRRLKEDKKGVEVGLYVMINCKSVKFYTVYPAGFSPL